jgi:hypothetical protein
MDKQFCRRLERLTDQNVAPGERIVLSSLRSAHRRASASRLILVTRAYVVSRKITWRT